MKFAAACWVAGGMLVVSPAADAKPGIHGPAVSTWDTRASSVVVAGREGFLDGGHFFIGSYNANFTSTTGTLSSQFGMHYLNFRAGEGESVSHGLSGTATAVFSLPVTDRYDNGVPKFAVSYFIGGAPTALVNGKLNYLSIPLVAGLALPWSPSRGLTIAPWFEVSPGLNLDTKIQPVSLTIADMAKYCPDPSKGCDFSQAAAQDLVSRSLTWDISMTVGARGGLDLSAHLNDSVDFNLGAMVGTIDTAFKGKRVVWAGAGIVYRWDDIVPAVLPSEHRLLHESCEAVEERFRLCPASERWIAPEQRQPPPSVNSPATDTTGPVPPATPAIPTPQPAYPPPAPPGPAPFN